MVAAVSLVWRAQRAAFAGQLILMTAAGLLPVAAAWLFRAILDDLVDGRTPGALVPLIVMIGLIGIAQPVLSNTEDYLSTQSGRAVLLTSIDRLFSAVSLLPGLRRVEDPDFQNKLQLAQRACGSGPSQVVGAGMSAVQAALTLVGFLAALLTLNPIMAGVVLAAAIPAVLAERGMARRRMALVIGTNYGQRRQFFYAGLLSDLAAAKELRLFGLGGFFRQRMLAELRTVQQSEDRVDRRQMYTYTFLAALGGIVAAGGLWWAVLAAAEHRMTVGDVSLLVAALAAAAGGLMAVIASSAQAYQALMMFRCYEEVVSLAPDLPVAAEPAQTPAMRLGIEVEDVWFRYGPDEPWILRGVSLFLPFGQAVALVGLNGAGKSTLVKLLCRFYDPDRGRILWDGVDLRQLDPIELRQHISAVFQDYMSYQLSAGENIAIGDLARARTDGALERAARQAGVHVTLAALPRGYDTMLARGFYDLTADGDTRQGVLLSGGQWQRVAVARALLRGDRDLVILDEPSSGLDAEAEHEMHALLRGERNARATVLISHRLNTVRDADHVVVISDGIVSEQGDHAALMSAGGTYARLFTLQARGYQVEELADGLAASCSAPLPGGARG
jgi:ATP-binding cassette, subfamily B, bacterial